jgi:hypothetical protein
MSNATYINRLMQLRTHQVGLIEDIHEYQFNVRWGGFFRTLSTLPQANGDRHIVVVKMSGEQPSELICLPEDRQSIEPSMRDVGKLIFVFLSVKSQQLKLASPFGGYRLADGQEVKVDLELTVQVTSAKDFWLAAKDPVALLESMVIGETQSYFLQVDSRNLIDKPLTDEQQGVEFSMHTIVQRLETKICGVSLSGIQIKRAFAQITFSDQLKAFLRRQLDNLFNPAGLLDRKHVDERIETAHLFDAFKLKDVIMALDPQLLDNFYSMPYGNAMSVVYEKLASAKAKFVDGQQNDKIAKLEQAIETAMRISLDETPIGNLKEKLAEELYKVVDDLKQTEVPSYEEFIHSQLKVKYHI